MEPRAKLVAMTIGHVPPPNDEAAFDFIQISAGEFAMYAARVSNPGNQHNFETSQRLSAYLQRAKHWSPFEMSNAVVEVVTTRDIAHQILRHVSFRFQEFSQRYAEVQNFHHDFPARRQDDKNRQNSIDDLDDETKEWWLQAQLDVVNVTEGIYREALRRKIAKECARKVLPEGLTETTLYMNGYLRSWIHYLAQRLDPSTQLEHRQVAQAIEPVLRKNIPEVFDVDAT